jgi:hypothetical protein
MKWNKKKCLSHRMNLSSLLEENGVDQPVGDGFQSQRGMEIGNARDGVLIFNLRAASGHVWMRQPPAQGTGDERLAHFGDEHFYTLQQLKGFEDAGHRFEHVCFCLVVDSMHGSTPRNRVIVTTPTIHKEAVNVVLQRFLSKRNTLKKSL